jgi:tetratricopeptide (TPR) repeat protein
MPQRPRHVRVCARLAFAIVVCAGMTTISTPAAQRVATFTLDATTVRLDAGVVDATGRTVPGLAPGDFEVTIDGKTRAVVSAEWVAAVSGKAAGTAAGRQPAKPDAEDALEASFSSNERGEALGSERGARDIVIAVDQNSFESGASRAVAAVVQQLLDRLPQDARIGLAFYPTRTPRVAPTRDRDRLRAALGQLAGSAERLPYTESGLTIGDALVVAMGSGQMQAERILDRECSRTAGRVDAMLTEDNTSCRQRLTSTARNLQAWARRRTLVSMNGLRDLLVGLASRGRPAAVVLVSSGLILGDRIRPLDLESEIRDVSGLAAAAQSSVYGLFVDSSYLEAMALDREQGRAFANADRDLRLDGLQTVVAAGGGMVASLQGANVAVFSRLASELDGYYVLTVESMPAERDGKTHPVKIRSAKPGVAVRTREQVVMPSARSYAGADAVNVALASPSPQRGLPMSVSTHVLREPGGASVRIVIAASIGRAVTGSEKIVVGYNLRTAAGGEAKGDVESRLLPAVGTGGEASLLFVDSAVVVQGRYLLRVAALDGAGKLGSVDHVVDAVLPTGPGGTTTSDLVLIDPLRRIEGMVSPIADGRISSSQLETLLELYPKAGQHVTEVAFAIADGVDGPAIVSGTTPAPEREPGTRVAAVSVDLSALPPGIYTAVARVLDGKTEVGRVSRPFKLDRLAMAAGGPRAPFSVVAVGGLLKPFGREDVLHADALAYFLDRLQAVDKEGASGAAAGALAAARSGRFDDIGALLAGARNDQLSAQFLKGLAQFAKGDLEPAAAQFRATLRLSNEFLPAAFYLGACYAAGGRDREAVGAWQTSLISEADARIVYDVLADALLRLKDGKRAAIVLSEARERWPADDAWLPRMAAAQILLSQRTDALATLAPYIDRHPQDVDAIFLALRLLYDARDSGTRVGTASDDAAAARKYGQMYRAAGGPDVSLVDRWVTFIAR